MARTHGKRNSTLSRAIGLRMLKSGQSLPSYLTGTTVQPDFRNRVICQSEEITMSVTQLDKGDAFLALHRGPRAFILANAWDAGSARILAGLGFSAIGTSSWA